MKVVIDPDDVKKLDADGRGRVYLGSEYADMDGIEVAILNGSETNSESGDSV